MKTEDLLDILLAGRSAAQVLADAARTGEIPSEEAHATDLEGTTEGGYSHGRMPSLIGVPADAGH
jgi:hypothetical protein